MSTLPPIPEAALDAADNAAEDLHNQGLACYGCCFRGGYARNGTTAAYPHIVAATLRWAADCVNDIEGADSRLELIADEIEAGL